MQIRLLPDKGDIVDTGNHNELINKEGLYKQLHNMQFKIKFKMLWGN